MNTNNSNTLVRKLSFLFIMLAFASPLCLSAISTFKGQLVYLKECRVCHLSSRIFVATHSFDEWKKMLDDAGVRLSDVHLKEDERYVNSKEGIPKSSHKYFKSDEYMQKYKELRDFILESAKKSEEVEAAYSR